MRSKSVSRREFVRQTGLLTTAGLILPGIAGYGRPSLHRQNLNGDIRISTDFINGGGEVRIVQKDPLVIRVKPHNEQDGGWSQVWWHFRVDGFPAGEELVLQLDRGKPSSAGISPQASFTYDQEVWGLTDTGFPAEIEGRESFIYKHTVRGDKVWFAYDLPYTPQQVESLLIREAKEDPKVDVFELCKTRNNRTVHALTFNAARTGGGKHYGIWLQARAHAFESGASWVLYELALWLLSDDSLAKDLRDVATITIVPIVDVDGVVEGRTGKNHHPYDHNRGWSDDRNHWPEVRATQKKLAAMAEQNELDMFIDFHGPAGLHHPYFIVPVEDSLPHKKQRVNRSKFLETLKAKPLDNAITKSQSMRNIHYSPRPWDQSVNNSSEWVIMKTTDHNIAMTLEVNMNTPLSTRDGYQAEAQALGRAMSRYFVNNQHKR